MEHGRENLLRYYDQRLTGRSPVIQKIEYPINVYFEAIPLKGKIDRIDTDHPDSAKATVIDFKTGRPQTEAEIRQGDYYRQLTFYALLLDVMRSPLHPHAFVLDFIGEGSDHPVERVFQITELDKEALKKLIKDVWGKIIALDFTPL
jgi:RecB family exonuclease